MKLVKQIINSATGTAALLLQNNVLCHGMEFPRCHMSDVTCTSVLFGVRAAVFMKAKYHLGAEVLSGGGVLVH